MQTEITNAGMSTSLITAIIGYANVLKNSNITQETLKGIRKVISAATVKEFNEIYNTVISIAKISAKFFKGDKAMMDKFSYAKTLSGMNQVKEKENGAPPPTPA